jgi:hypothetical protein
MIDNTLKNISDLFLYQVSKDLDKKLFYEAVNMILIVVTDLDDGQDVIKFISQRLKALSPTDKYQFIRRLRKEIEWLKSKVLETELQYKKINFFAEELSKLVFSLSNMKMGRHTFRFGIMIQRMAQESLALFRLSGSKGDAPVQIELYSKRKKMKAVHISGMAQGLATDMILSHRRRIRKSIMSKRRAGRTSVLKRYRKGKGE